MRGQATLTVRIVRCTAPFGWYASRVGLVVRVNATPRANFGTLHYACVQNVNKRVYKGFCVRKRDVIIQANDTCRIF